MIFDVFFVLLFVGLNGFFVAAEFSLLRVRASQVEAEAESGSWVAILVRHAVTHLEQYISATQIGITLSSLALGWLGEPVVAEALRSLFHSSGISESPELAEQIAMPVAFLLITTMHLVFGEIVPRSVAIADPRQTAFATILPLRVFAAVAKPFVKFVNWMSRTVLSPFNITVSESHATHSADELRLLLAESAQSAELGTIQATEHEIIDNVFTFDERTVRQIMVPRMQMVTVSKDLTVEQVFGLFVAEGYSRIPVHAEARDHIVGVVHSKDVLKAYRDRRFHRVEEIMRTAMFVPDTKRVAELLKEFQAKRTHMALAVDEFGATSGLVTLEDIVEELVGEIQDEYDEETPALERKGDDRFVIRTEASIVDVNRLLPEPLPESTDYSTLGGLINVIFNVIPEVGQSETFGRYEFTVLRRSRRRVEQVELKLIPAGDDYLEDE